MLSAETEYSKISKSICNNLLKLQGLNAFITKKQCEKVTIYTRSGSEKQWKIGPDGFLRFKGFVYMPAEKAIRSEMIYIHYNTDLAGHFGISKMLKLIRRKYFWLSLKKDIKSYIKSCYKCQRGKPRRHCLYGELAPILIPLKPWEKITIDFITDLPSNK